MGSKKAKKLKGSITYKSVTPYYLIAAGIPFIVHRTNDDEYMEDQYVHAVIDSSNQYDSKPLENIYFYDGRRGLTNMKIKKHAGQDLDYEKAIYQSPRRSNNSEDDLEVSGGPIRNSVQALSIILRDAVEINSDRIVLIMRDIDPDLKNANFTNQVKRFSEDPILNAKLTVILLTYTTELPSELREYAILKDTPYMSLDEVEKFILDTDVDSVAKHSKPYAKALSGFSYKQIINAFEIVRQTEDNIDERVKLIEEIKKGLHESPYLEMRRSSYGLESIGGNNILKAKLSKYAYVYHHHEEAKKAQLEGIKGILLVGPPGTAKSVMSEAFARELGLPFLILRMGQIYGKFLGDSEKNLKQALDFAESIQCLLQIDEIDKEVGENNNSTNATETRIVGSLLTRIAESKNTVFVATANRIHDLPPELMRKGRFDHIFFIDLPTAPERHAIFEIHLKKRGQDPSKMQEEIKKACLLTEGYTGAEIEFIIREAMLDSFAASKGKEALMWKTIYDIIESELPHSLHFGERFDKARTDLATIAKAASSQSKFATAVQEAKQSRTQMRQKAKKKS